MRRERALSIILMVIGVLMLIGGALWWWLGYRASRLDPFSAFNQVWPFGTAFVGLLVAAAGASTFPNE